MLCGRGRVVLGSETAGTLGLQEGAIIDWVERAAPPRTNSV
jgi:hypothetical protein